jgi:hypothetical protein
MRLKYCAHFPVAAWIAAVTNPTYYGLRNYNVDEQIGMEKAPQKYKRT